MTEEEAVPAPGYGRPPYQVKRFPGLLTEWCAVCNREGNNALTFPSMPGVKFTDFDRATAIAEMWNREGVQA